MSERSGNPAKKAAATRAKKEAKAAVEQANEAAPSRKVKVTGKNARRGVTVEVLPFMEWDADWRDYLPEDEMPDVPGWARAVLDDENLAKWKAAKPTNASAIEFLTDYFAEQGEDLGESSDSQES